MVSLAKLCRLLWVVRRRVITTEQSADEVSAGGGSVDQGPVRCYGLQQKFFTRTIRSKTAWSST